jgi:3-hydroxybutyryl-CoA dehydrogenase
VSSAPVIERIGVAGAGTMGAGIAQLACLGGFRTLLHDPDPEALARGEQRLRAELVKGADRGHWSQSEAEAASARLLATPELADLADCELVIEAAPESLELKQRLFKALAETCGSDAILATNTSSLSVTAIAAAAPRPWRACGMHFFNPPTRMRLVEVVAGEETSEETMSTALEVVHQMKREPVRAGDAIGFISNRVNRPFTLEALRLVGDGISDPAQVDRIVRIGGGYRMGPFELMDLVGIDVNFAVARSFWEQSFGEPRWRPHPLQARMVAAGRLGRKSGRGWYHYGDGQHRPDDPPPLEPAASPPSPPAACEAVEGDGFRAVCIEATTLAVRGAADAIGYVAFPDPASAPVIELVRGPAASTDALSAAGRHFAAMGKHVECVTGDAPGLVLGRIVGQLVNEAHFAAGAGIGEPADIDTAMRLGFNHPRGPFEWAAAIGPRRVADILDALHRELGEERYRVAPSLRAAAATG